MCEGDGGTEGEREGEREGRERERTSCLSQSVIFCLFVCLVSCNRPCAQYEKWHRKEHILPLLCWAGIGGEGGTMVDVRWKVW